MNKFKTTIKDDIWIILLDIIAVNASYFLALLTRFFVGGKFYASLRELPYEYSKFAPFYTIICIIVFFFFRLYGGMWRYAGINDMNRIIKASVLTTIVQVIGTLIFVKRMPLTFYFIGAALQFVFVCLIRFSYRIVTVEMHRLRDKRNAVNALIIGADDLGRAVLKQVEGSSAYRPIAIVDTKNEIVGKAIDGIAVFGTEDVDRILDDYDIKAIFIGEAQMNKDLRKRINAIAITKEIKVVDNTSYLTYIGELETVAAIPPVVDGGKKMIPFSPPDIGDAEIEEVVEALKSGWITTGPRTKHLERRLAAYIETGETDVDTEADPGRWNNRVVCLNSATAAEELNLRVLGVGPGDEVIVPAYTYTASASAAIHCDAKVVFVDIQKDGDSITHCPEMDYEKLEAAINERTKAVVVVDLGGIVADYEKVFEIVERKKNLFRAIESDGTPLGDLNSRIQKAIGRVAVLSDCAHGLGASRVINGTRKYTGAIADFTSFSFHAVKNFTTAEGGASTWKPIAGVENAELYKFYQLLSLHGQNKDALAKTKVGAWEYDIIGPWYKCNMTDIMAAIGLRQLDRYPKLLARRVEIIKKYDAVCDELGIEHLHHHVDGMDSSNHLYLIRIPGADVEKRNKIIEEMAKTGVSTNVHYKPLPMMTAYGKDCSDYPNTFDYYHNLLTLPLHTLLTDDDVEKVCDSLKTVIQAYG